MIKTNRKLHYVISTITRVKNAIKSMADLNACDLHLLLEIKYDTQYANDSFYHTICLLFAERGYCLIIGRDENDDPNISISITNGIDYYNMYSIDNYIEVIKIIKELK